MAELILTFNGQACEEIPFKDDSITIGRKEENDIRIENLAVSNHHARIDRIGADFILTDLQSTNGTFINDKRMTSCKLKHGDNIQIGKHIIIFRASEKEQSGQFDIDKTMILDTEKQRNLLSKQENTPIKIKKPGKRGILTFIDNSGLDDIELVKKLTRIGKSENSEIQLSGLFMGATAATISKRPSGYTISFAGGISKLKVNGHIVKQGVQLNDFDIIEIGSYKFQFYNKEIK